MFAKLKVFLRALFRKQRAEQEMDEEMKFHLDMEIQQNISRGMSPADARIAALRAFGGVEQTKEECRDSWGSRMIESLVQDLRYGLRVLTRSPGFTFVALTTLALGIGANTAIFSVVYGVLMRPLPYEDGGKLVVLHQQVMQPEEQDFGFSATDIADFNSQNDTLCGLAEHHTMSFLLYGRQEPERVQTAVVSANFFDLLGVKPLYGRTFVSSDDQKGADAVLVLSYKYWRQSHLGDPDIVGKVFTMNDRPHTVIGVLPPIPQYPVENDVYMPTVACPTRSGQLASTRRTFRMLSAFGRLKPEATLAQAKSDVSRIGSSLQQSFPQDYPENRGYSASLESLEEDLTSTARPTFLVLLATAALVLLIACANVANLTLARLMRREREMALRAALGAGRGRLVRQLLSESLLLAVGGGLLGLLLASVAVKMLVTFAARFTTRAAEIEIDGTVLLFTLGISILTGVAFGLMPAFTSEQSLSAALKEGGRSTSSRRRRRARSALIVAQVAISFVLLIGAGLMTRSFLRLQQVSPGFNAENVLKIRVSANPTKINSREKFMEFQKRILDRVRTQPGVLSAAVASTYPLNPFGRIYGPNNNSYQVEGQPLAEGDTPPQADIRVVSTDYFETIRTPLISGRTFTEADNEKGMLVGIVNQSMAGRFGGADPIGKRLSTDRGQRWIQIVGVVGDVKQYALERDATDELYLPSLQAPGGGTLLARTSAEPMSTATMLRDAIHEVDGETAVDNVQTLETVRDEALASPKLMTILLGLFAALALVITAAGVAGVIALSVSHRAHELGVRLALGSTSAAAVGLIMRQGMLLVVGGLLLGGLVLGIAGSLGGFQIMSTILYSVAPSDPPTLLFVSGGLLLVAAVAAFVPARRVTAIDPMVALRSE
jgi:predicted permease